MFKNAKILVLLLIAVSLYLPLIAQEEAPVVEDTTVVVKPVEQAVEMEMEFEKAPEMGGFELLARKILGSGFVDIFIQGGFVMWPMLILVIWAIATIIWKLVALNYARENLNEMMDEIIPIVREGNYADAISKLEARKGPTAMVLRMGLRKAEQGVEVVEKAIESASVLEMAFLEKGFIALSTTISLAPMFGFFGTMVGMIQAFDSIAKAGEVDPTIVAEGIKVALITTAAGLAIAIPIQFFNNIFMGMVDGLTLEMQKGSEQLIEVLVEKKQGE